MTNAANTIAAYLDASETFAPAGAFGTELGETGFASTYGYGSGSYSMTEWAEWTALHAAERAVEAEHAVETCECCGPELTAEGKAEMARVRAKLTPRWYQRRHPRRGF